MRMTCKALSAIPAMIFALGLGSALAAPAGGPAAIGIDDEARLVHKTHGCHRSCEWGIGRGWHRHVGPACAPTWCSPQAKQPFRCWVDRYGVRHCLW